jgi:hypothetical protein
MRDNAAPISSSKLGCHSLGASTTPSSELNSSAMGLYYADSLNFEDLAAACEQEGRWEFFCLIAPLRIEKGTGSPVNPIAVF